MWSLVKVSAYSLLCVCVPTVTVLWFLLEIDVNREGYTLEHWACTTMPGLVKSIILSKRSQFQMVVH
jgi:hypothetical protein